MYWVRKRHRNDQWSDAKYCPTRTDVDIMRDKMKEGDEILIIPEDIWTKRFNDLIPFENVEEES